MLRLSGAHAGDQRKSSGAKASKVTWRGSPDPSAGASQMSWWPERPE